VAKELNDFMRTHNSMDIVVNYFNQSEVKKKGYLVSIEQNGNTTV
jgi:hypothetical protein